MLSFIEPDAESYALGDVDFGQLYLGGRIPAYEATDSGLYEVSDVFYYPIIEGNKWVATATVFYNNSDLPIVQVSAAYANEFDNDTEKEVSLLFDSSAAYVLQDGITTQVAASPEVNEELVSVDTIENVELEAQEGILLEAVESLEVMQISRLRNDRQYYLSVPGIKQSSGSKQCWAACIAAIDRFCSGTRTTIDDVYNRTGVTKYVGQTRHQSQDHLEKKYGYSTSNKYPSNLSWYDLKSQIYGYGRPIFAGIEYGSGNIGHAVVIRGYYENSSSSSLGSISYMDPLVGYNLASNVPSENDYAYCESGSTRRYNFDGFLLIN